jgi:two-component system OmpR family sensor kinase/two-component system sensor histidine kinase BaeS
MNTLAGRLLIAFALVILVGSLMTIALAGRTTSSEIRHLMIGTAPGQMQMVDALTLRSQLADSYAQSGEWEAAKLFLRQNSFHLRMMGGAVILADADGAIIVGATSGQLSSSEEAEALPIRVNNQVVGLLVLRDEMHSQMASPMVEEVVKRVNRAVWLATSVAAVLAFALALLIVRTISAPLARVADASQAVASGDLSARAPIAGPSEVQSVALAFNKMADSLNEQEALRRAMLADVTHELRTPLTVMQGQIEALIDGIFPPTPEHLAPLHSQTLHLARVVEDLRTLAHADAGQLKLEQVAVSLPKLVSDLLHALEADATAKQISLSSQIPLTLPPLRADAVRLRQVLANLLTNALRHTPPNGQIIVAAREDKTHAELTVTDTGEGINPDDLPHIFERYYRTDGSRPPSREGSGLGLAIARRLTESHGGTIAIRSQLGVGTIVTLTWPKDL